jgi:phosphate-selective porin
MKRETAALRLTARPLRLISAPGSLKELETSVAFTSSDVPEGLTSLRGESYSGKTIAPSVYTKGRRLRGGTDLNWTSGDFSLKGEYAIVKQERDEQSVRATRLPDVIARGWYVAGLWEVIDGRLRIGARYDTIRFGSGNQPALASRSPRDPNVVETSDRAWTLGLNWFVTRQVKVQINEIREGFQDRQFWRAMARLQFVM